MRNKKNIILMAIMTFLCATFLTGCMRMKIEMEFKPKYKRKEGKQMICKNCGAEIPDGSKFCTKCGTPMEIDATLNDDTAETVTETVHVPEPEPVQIQTQNVPISTTGQSKDKKKINIVPVIAAAAVGLVLIIGIVAFLKLRKTTINLSEYLEFSAEGYDGYGTVSAEFDKDRFVKDYKEKIRPSKKLKSMIKDDDTLENILERNDLKLTKEKDVATLFALIYGSRGKLDETNFDQLSNGDVVIYDWNIETDSKSAEEMIEFAKSAFNVKLVSDKAEYTVEGLKEVAKFDPFEDLSVSFTGISPGGRTEMDYSGIEFNYYDFNADKTTGLKNGDTVKVTISARDMTYFAENYGRIPETLEKEYTVEGLDEYVELYSDIPDDVITEMHKEVEDTILAYAASSYNKESSLSDLTYAGYIFNTIKNTDDYYYNHYNRLYIIFSGTLSNTENNFRASKVYYPVEFYDLLKSGDDVTYDNSDIKGYSSLDNSWYSTKGYINPLVCYMELAESDRDNYKIECGDGFEKYAEQEDIEKIADISDDYKEELKADAVDAIESYISSYSYDDYSTTDVEYVGEYLLIAKSQASNYEKNNKYYHRCDGDTYSSCW